MATESICREWPEPTLLSPTCFRYAIYVRGHLDAHWADWLGGTTIKHEEGGVTRIEGSMKDQAALHGLFDILSELNLPIVALQRLTSVPGDGSLRWPRAMGLGTEVRSADQEQG
jgi:hypothetical protein